MGATHEWIDGESYWWVTLRRTEMSNSKRFAVDGSSLLLTPREMLDAIRDVKAWSDNIAAALASIEFDEDGMVRDD